MKLLFYCEALCNVCLEKCFMNEVVIIIIIMWRFHGYTITIMSSGNSTFIVTDFVHRRCDRRQNLVFDCSVQCKKKKKVFYHCNILFDVS